MLLKTKASIQVRFLNQGWVLALEKQVGEVYTFFGIDLI